MCPHEMKLVTIKLTVSLPKWQFWRQCPVSDIWYFTEYPDEEIGKHITIVTEFLRSVYDTVDSPGIFEFLYT